MPLLLHRAPRADQLVDGLPSTFPPLRTHGEEPLDFEQRLAGCNTREDLTLLWYSTEDLALRAQVETKARAL